ncbi:hypothetical protein Tco_0236252 [Tanacetum coccineum]
MSITKEQQQALDNALVSWEQCLTIGSCNYRLSTTFKPKEPTFQVALDVLSLTPFYPAFLITASVPVVYMQEFWATVTYQKHHIKFKMNKKSYSFDLDTFRNMLQMYPKLPGQKFVDPPFEEDILTFMRELGYSGNIKLLSDVKVDMLPQPWRTFGTIINTCLSGKVTGYDTLRLSRAQILWGLYHQKKVDYVYLLWEDLVFQIENKESRKNKYIFIPQYGAILPDNLTTPAMKESEAYKTYHDLATGKVQPKPKYVRRSSRSKTEQAPKPSPGKRVKATAKPATKQSLIQTHSSHARGSGAHEGTGVTPVPDVPNYGSDEEQLSWKSNDDDDTRSDDDVNKGKDDQDDDDDERTESDTRQEEEVNKEDSFDPRVQTPSYVESTYDEVNDDEIQGANVEGEEMDEEAPNEEEEGNELYRDIKVNLAGQDVEMTDAQQTNVQTTQVIEDTHVIITPVNPEGQQQSSSVSSGFVSNMLNLDPESGIDSIFNLNTEATSMVDVPVTTIVEPPLLFDHRLKALEDNFSEFMQTNQFVEAISTILGIVDAYLANKMHKTIKIAIQLQSDRLREEAQAENEDFINKINDNIKKIIKDQVLTCSSKESKTSYAVAAKLFKLELKKILIDKIESNKSIHRSDEQKNLYKALVDAYESDKLILDTYGDTISFKRRRDDEDKDEEPSAGSNRGSKRKRAGKEPESTSAPKEKTAKTTRKSTKGSKSQHKTASESAQAEEPMHTTKDLEDPAHQEFDTGVTEDQPNEESPWFPDWFHRPTKLTSLDRDWNMTLPDTHGPVQPWLSSLVQKEDPRESFNELMDTPLDFSAFLMNRLKVDTLTPELLAGPTFELMKGSCKSLTELEYFLEEVYKATTEQLDWINPEGRRVAPFDHFINNDLEYLSCGVSSRKYATSVTKTKAADYGHIKYIEELVPNTMWSPVPVDYDKHALWGISHWGRKRQQFYGFAVNRESVRDVYFKRRIIAVTKLEIVEWQNYKHLDWITVRRDDDKLYKFKEGDLKRLRIQDIKDMLLLLVQGKLTNRIVEERLAFNVSLRMFTRSIVIQRRVEDLQLAYSTPRGFIYQNKGKKNRLMRIDELHKFSDGTLDDVQTALNDRLKGIWMQYLPQTIWRQRDKDNAGAMIQAIEKQLKTRRIMRSLEKFVGGRPYEGDFRLLQRTI